jgi:hypothetical protein
MAVGMCGARGGGTVACIAAFTPPMKELDQRILVAGAQERAEAEGFAWHLDSILSRGKRPLSEARRRLYIQRARDELNDVAPQDRRPPTEAAYDAVSQLLMKVICDRGSTMSDQILIYASSNGDCWYLARDAHPETMLVRHQPNRASGGRSTFTEIDAFLAEGPSPQQEALRRVLDKKYPVRARQLSDCPVRLERCRIEGRKPALLRIPLLSHLLFDRQTGVCCRSLLLSI